MPQNSHCPRCVHKSTCTLVVFQPKVHIFFSVVMSPLFFELHFVVLHLLFCGPCNLFCTTNDLYKLPVFSCAPSAILYEITIHFLQICFWIGCTLFFILFLFFFQCRNKRKNGTFFQLQLFLQKIIFTIIKWLNKTKGTHLMNKWKTVLFSLKTSFAESNVWKQPQEERFKNCVDVFHSWG